MAIEHHPIAFPKLDPAQRAALAAYGRAEHYEVGQTLFAAGERDFGFFVVESGRVAIIDRSSGDDEIVAMHEAGEFTGDVDMLTGRPVIVSAIAWTACDVVRIPAGELRRILGEQPLLSDLLLRAFLMRRQLYEASDFTGVRVIGSRYSRDTHRIRALLAKNQVPFSWIDLENDPRVDALLGQFQIEPDDTPVVVCIDGRMLRNPSDAELADCVGMRRPVDRKVVDLVIVGAGPAGLAAAVYGASEGLSTLVLDRTGPGGQAAASSKIENYMGFPLGLSGADLANRALLQAEKFGAILSSPAEVVRLDTEDGYHSLLLASGECISARSVLIASGARYRTLDVEGCARFEGSGVYYAATPVEAQLCRRARVVIVGDGNSAGQAAVFLAGHAQAVLLLIRGDDLGLTMSHYLKRRIEQTPNIELRRHTEISAMRGDESLASIEMTCRANGRGDSVDCAAVFVFIGSAPHTAWLPKAIEVDEGGFIKTGPQLGAWALRRAPFLLETSRPGVLAAGDVRQGSTKRVASAVGEGAMAVQFVHQALAAH